MPLTNQQQETIIADMQGGTVLKARLSRVTGDAISICIDSYTVWIRPDKAGGLEVYRRNKEDE
jgi:hypothetical protein